MTKYPQKNKPLNEFQNFVNIIPELLEKRKADNTETDKEKLFEFREWSVKVEPIYNRNIKSAKTAIKEYHTQNKRLLSPTTFEIMNRHFLEETHSNVIAYLLRKDTDKILLKTIIDNFGKQKVMDLPKLDNNEYKVIREAIVDNKRIDILIKSKKYIIVIENKFYSKLHAIDDTTNQTEFYFDKINKKYKNKRKLFMILDYKGSEFCNGYQRMDYNDLLSVLDTPKVINSTFKDDHIYEEYINLLRRLLNNICGVSLGNIDEINILSTLNNLTEVLQNGIKR